MNAHRLLDKTQKGVDEIRERRHKLPSKLRMLLLLVDGRHSASQVAAQAEKIGLASDAVEDLVLRGFIAFLEEAVPPASPAGKEEGDALPTSSYDTYRKAYEFMNSTIVDALGLKSFFFTLKIEKTANLEDLRRLMDDYVKAMNKSLGEARAELFIERMRQLMA